MCVCIHIEGNVAALQVGLCEMAVVVTTGYGAPLL